MLCSLLAYDDDYNVIAMKPAQREPRPDGTWQLVDFEERELAGVEMTSVWIVERWEGEYGVGTPRPARGAKTWPEWIDRYTDFRVELEGPAGQKRIAALVHRQSGYRRERAAIEADLKRRMDAARAEAVENGALLRELYVDAGIVSPEEAASIPDPDPERVDARELLGGPTRPLSLDDDGRTIGRGPVTADVAPLVG